MIPDWLSSDNLSRMISDSDFRESAFWFAAREIHSLFRRQPESPTDIFEEDWDNLIILDGCRYDTFQKKICEFEFDGTLSKKVSAGSSSPEFIASNFQKRDLHDTVYVTANPYVRNISHDTFHATYSLLSDEYWDKEFDTVLPGIVVEEALSALNRHPNKRHIIHFMQPHYPFIGKLGRQIDHRGYENGFGGTKIDSTSIWTALRSGEKSLELDRVRTAYEENLEVVLKEIGDLLRQMEGKIIITADHGNLLGEYLWPVPLRDYGHPKNTNLPELRYVPWYTVKKGDRPQIVADQPIGDHQSTHSNVIDDRLESLGYRV